MKSHSGMTIFTSKRPLAWGQLDVPMLGLQKDWYGTPLVPQPAFSLVLDAQHLWFIAHHRKAAIIHPKARPGIFQAELWKYDCAELFIADPVSGRYLEFNLAPNSAWWSCEFTAPLVRDDEVDIPMPDVLSFSEIAADGAWLAAMTMPLDLLEARLNFGSQSRINVSMILEYPHQRFISATDLGGEKPHFHQPDRFSQVRFTELPK
ncbi:MAG: hypothetical protein H8M99_10540 [Gloeobacteraceae cyanobacterium ES-bin-144]|nr:hypothetical protein [Verrucomicrobiales bacterium]